MRIENESKRISVSGVRDKPGRYLSDRIMAMNKPNLYGIKYRSITRPFHRTCKKLRDKNNKSRYCVDVM